MNDIRLDFAVEIAALIGASVMPRRCQRVISKDEAGTQNVCGYPLLMKPDQDLEFCWFCVTDKKSAQSARTVLVKAQMAEKGIYMMKDHSHPALTADDTELARWPKGWVL